MEADDLPWQPVSGAAEGRKSPAQHHYSLLSQHRGMCTDYKGAKIKKFGFVCFYTVSDEIKKTLPATDLQKVLFNREQCSNNKLL